LTTALSALVDAAQVFPSIIKADLHACILHIFATILGTGACQATVVPQSLPIFKRFVTSLTRDAEATGDTNTQLRATLTRFLTILRHAQQREFDAALACEKNTNLAATILLSSASSAFSPTDPLLARFTAALSDCLSARLTSKVAATCTRSLLLLPKTTPTESAIAAQILPHALSFLTLPSSADPSAHPIIASSLVAFTASLPASKRGTAAKLVIPALLAYAKSDESARADTAAKLLELASVDAEAFRGVVGGLDAGQRSFMEGVLKSAQGGPKKEERSEGGEPTIALKMNF
jgi:hypothetical protein